MVAAGVRAIYTGIQPTEQTKKKYLNAVIHFLGLLWGFFFFNVFKAGHFHFNKRPPFQILLFLYNIGHCISKIKHY